MSPAPYKILVVANETVGGRALIDAILRHAEKARGEGREPSVFVACPQNQPKKGFVVYDETVREAAENRLQTTLAQLREVGVAATGEIMDPDPYSATMDAFNAHPVDVIVISTHPDTRSGWLRRDLIDRVRDASGLAVEHVIVDPETEGLPFHVTLAVANRTASGDELLAALKAKAASGVEKERGRLFIVTVPQEGGDGQASRRARTRLKLVLDRLHAAGLFAAGMIGDPDPYTAITNAVQYFRVDDIVISTFSETKSGWLRADLIERVSRSTGKPVEH